MFRHGWREFLPRTTIWISDTSCQIINRTFQLHWRDPPGTLATAWNVGFVDIGWTYLGFTKGAVQQRQGMLVLNIQKVPLQAFLQCSHRVSLGKVLEH
jgi:hypothetical protein